MATYGQPMAKGLTGYHGNQCRKLCSRRGMERVLGRTNPGGKPAVPGLQDLDARHAGYVQATLDIMDAIERGLSEAHRAPVNFEAMRRAVDDFTKCATRLSRGNGPGAVAAPCRKGWAMCDHLFAHHMLPQMEALWEDRRLTLAQMGTTNLEAFNRPSKGLYQRCTGGGVAHFDGAHIPLIRIIRSADTACRLGRRRAYAQLPPVVRRCPRRLIRFDAMRSCFVCSGVRRLHLCKPTATACDRPAQVRSLRAVHLLYRSQHLRSSARGPAAWARRSQLQEEGPTRPSTTACRRVLCREFSAYANDRQILLLI